MATDIKDPIKVRAGQIGARKRWGEPRLVRLDDLTMAQRQLVMALVDAARSQKAATTDVETIAAADAGGHGNDLPAS